MWQKLIKRSLIQENALLFPQLNFQEDIPFSYIAMALANKISLMPEAFIHYRKKREGSLIVESQKALANYWQPWQILWNDLQKHHLKEQFTNAFKDAFFRIIRYPLQNRISEEKIGILGQLATNLSSDIQRILFDIGNQETKISLIISAYNAAEFLPECLNSCLNQTLKEIEIICVDDGSTDNTLQILNVYAKQDKRIKVIHQENNGLPISRNNAMKIATGEYIQFVDADDWLEPDACECLYLYAKIYDLDMLSFAATDFKNDTKIEYEEDYHCLKWLPEKSLSVFTWQHILPIIQNIAVTSPLTIYRYQYLIDHELHWINKKVAYEDTPFFTMALLKGARMGALPARLYHKRVHDDAITQNMKTNFPDYCWIIKYTLKNIYHFVGNSSILVQYSYAFINKAYNNYKKLDQSIQDQMIKHIYKLSFHILKTYHIPLPKDILVLCNIYLAKQSFKKKSGFFFWNSIAQWRQYGYSLNPLRISFKPFFITFFGKLICSKSQSDVFIPKISKKENGINERFILCFDNLGDSITEAIDTYTFFKWLQENNIPSKYVIHPQNILAPKLIGNKDVIISNYKNFFINCADILAKSKCVVTSFGLYDNKLNKSIKKLPWLNYIFIGHGPTLLNIYSVKFYSQSNFDYIASNLTSTPSIYSKRHLWKDKQILCGLPRWDNLKRISHKTKNIFIFFTWRKSIEKYPTSHKIYQERILKFLNSPKLNALLQENNITLNIALHHAMLLNGANIDIPENVHLTPTTDISRIIGTTDLMITDYSSIMFDFMFLDIPTLFYRFDDDVHYPDKRDNLNAKSAKSHDHELYNVFYDEDAVLKKIEYYINHNFELEPEYKKINDSLFWERENICQHLYDALQKLPPKKK